MSENENMMVPVGTKGEYEVYSIMQGSIEDSMELEAEISTHYKHDTVGVFSTSDDIDTNFIRINGRAYEYVNWGKDNEAPYRNQ